MLCIGIYEENPERRKQLREQIVRYSMQTDLDFSIAHITREASGENVRSFADNIQIALLSMESPGYLETGREIYRGNPDCRICFYQREKGDLEPLLETRPIGFYRSEAMFAHKQLQYTEEPVFLEQLNRIVADVLRNGGIFRYETRKQLILLPVQDILYFRSDLKYVDIHMTNNRGQRIFGRLSDMEQALEASRLSTGFLRIHKSYIVNLQHIQLLDKGEHTVVLKNGEQLPVSNAQYPMVQQLLTQGK